MVVKKTVLSPKIYDNRWIHNEGLYSTRIHIIVSVDKCTRRHLQSWSRTSTRNTRFATGRCRCKVGILSFGWDTSRNNEIHCAEWNTPSTVAVSSTLQNILFRQIEIGSILNFDEWFCPCYCREDPTRTAISLVLDGCHSTIITPIEARWSRCLNQRRWTDGHWYWLRKGDPKSRSNFVLRPIAKCVKGLSITTTSCVMCLNRLTCFNEFILT